MIKIWVYSEWAYGCSPLSYNDNNSIKYVKSFLLTWKIHTKIHSQMCETSHEYVSLTGINITDQNGMHQVARNHGFLQPQATHCKIGSKWDLDNCLQIPPPFHHFLGFLIRQFFNIRCKKATLGISDRFCLFSRIYEIFRKFKKEICSRIVGSNFSRHYGIQKFQRCAENRKTHVFRNS